MSNSNQSLDCVVLGAGVNGMVAALMVARSGRRVTVFDSNSAAGGLSRTLDLADGYRTPGLHLSTEMVDLDIASEILPSAQLAPPPSYAAYATCEPGGGLRVLRSGAESAEVERLHEHIGHFSAVLKQHLTRQPLNIVEAEGAPLAELLRRGISIRRLGAKRMYELLRLPPLSIKDFLGEWLADECLMATLSIPSLRGSFLSPAAPGGAANYLVRHALRGPGLQWLPHELVDQLFNAATQAGVEFRFDAELINIAPASAGPSRFELSIISDSGGSNATCRTLLSSAHPQTTMLKLIRPTHLKPSAREHLTWYRSRGTVAQCNYAVEGELGFKDASEVDSAVLALNWQHVERAFNPVKYGELPSHPTLEVRLFRGASCGLCPKGNTLVSAMCHNVPTALKKGWDAGADEVLNRSVLAVLETAMPGLGDRVRGHRIFVPEQIEGQFHTPGGNLNQGEVALDQLLVRPSPACSQYKTPIPGLWLCGGGTHPGGGLTLRNGYMAAKACLTARD